MSKSPSLKFEETIQAPADQVYRALTNAAALQSWFADFAEINATKGGRFYAWWNTGYYAVGTVKKCKPDEKIKLGWCGKGEPEATQVIFSLAEKDNATHVKIKHKGVGKVALWTDDNEKQIRDGWQRALANLKSVLETGLDKRIFDLPMLGVFPAALVDEKMIAELDLPIETGVRISGVLAGMSAESAGLQGNDVIFSINGHELKTFPDFGKAIAGKQAGERVDVVFYRGSEAKTVEMVLSGRPAPKLPSSAAELAQQTAAIYAEVDAELNALFKGVSEKEAAARPAPEEWSAKETLAHLIYSERWLHLAITCFIGNYRTGGFHNDLGMHTAIANAYSLPDLIAELKRCEAITVAAVRELPDEFIADKRRLMELVQNVGEYGFALHTRSHFPQIQAAIEAVRAHTADG